MTPAEAAAYLNVSPRFIRRLVAQGRIARVKVGRFNRFEVADLDDYLAAGHIEAIRPTR